MRMALGAAGRHVWVSCSVPARSCSSQVRRRGLLASFATSRLIANQLWNTSPQDPLTLGAAVSVVAVVALAACYSRPARDGRRSDDGTAPGLKWRSRR